MHSPLITSRGWRNFHSFIKKFVRILVWSVVRFEIIKDGELAVHNSYGMSNQETKQAVDEHTIYHWASITKTFTGIAIMQLRDRGLLKLTDPITNYLPELRQVHNPYGSMDTITLKHIITHTAGFRSSTWPWLEEAWQPHSPQHWEQLVAMLPYTEIKFKPGTQWNYSNPGIVFLGMVIEQLSNDDYEYYINKNILKPLGLHHSYFDSAPPHLRPYLSQSYWIDSAKNLKPAKFNLNTGITVSNGGLSAPLTDMTRYINFLLGNAPAEAYEQVLSQSSLNEMWQPYHKIVEEEPYGADQEWQGLAFFLEDIYDMRVVGHSGWQNGFQSHIYFQPESNIGYIVAYNTAGQGARGLDDKMKEYVLKNIFRPAVK